MYLIHVKEVLLLKLIERPPREVSTNGKSTVAEFELKKLSKVNCACSYQYGNMRTDRTYMAAANCMLCRLH